MRRTSHNKDGIPGANREITPVMLPGLQSEASGISHAENHIADKMREITRVDLQDEIPEGRQYIHGRMGVCEESQVETGRVKILPSPEELLILSIQSSPVQCFYKGVLFGVLAVSLTILGIRFARRVIVPSMDGMLS